jgi:hypothetical protein
MGIQTAVLLFVAVLFLGTLACLEIGGILGRRAMARSGSVPAGLGTVEGVAFALLGLLLAFTFSGAASRFDARRALIVEEANDIGTAWLRLDLVPEEAQPKLREGFRRYVDARLAMYRAAPDLEAALKESAKATALQNEIWADAVAATRNGGTPAPMLLLPALNAMIDITTTRTSALQMHPPKAVFAILGLMSFACALLAGFEMAGSAERSRLHMLLFAFILAFTIYVILDFEFPRIGFIRVDDFDQLLVDVRSAMK